MRETMKWPVICDRQHAIAVRGPLQAGAMNADCAGIPSSAYCWTASTFVWKGGKNLPLEGDPLSGLTSWHGRTTAAHWWAGVQRGASVLNRWRCPRSDGRRQI